MSDVHRVRNGFTLVEMLVSLALLGLASVLLSLGIAAAARTGARDAIDTNAVDAVSAAQMMLRARIEGMKAITSAHSAAAEVDSRGTATTFDFIGDPLGSRAPDGLQRYRLARTAAGDLILYTASTLDPRIDAGDGRAVGWTPMPLVSGTTALRLRYYGDARIGGGKAWQSTWFDRQQPPDLVGIQVSFGAHDQRVWPDMMIRPRATMNEACRLDPGTGTCLTAQ